MTRLFIHEQVLTDPMGTFDFRPGTLWALRAISNTGISVCLSESSLSAIRKKLLLQEKIDFIDREEADFSLSIDGKEFILLHKDFSEVLLKNSNWQSIVRFFEYPPRTASLIRNTRETQIQVSLNLDGSGASEISTGLNFFDHMLEQISKHGLVDLHISCKGDLHIDEHHTIEDVGIALGECIKKAVGNKKGLERYGFVLAMDEAKATVALDFSGRPFLVFDGEFKREFIGDIPTEMIKHFFYSLAINAGLTLNISFTGENDHHKVEACFKGFGRALKSAVERNPRIISDIPSSKGVL